MSKKKGKGKAAPTKAPRKATRRRAATTASAGPRTGSTGGRTAQATIFIFRTGSGMRNRSTWCGLMTKQPSGLRQSEAIFARNLFGATPAEAVRFVSSRISLRIFSAVSVAVGMPVSSFVTSR